MAFTALWDLACSTAVAGRQMELEDRDPPAFDWINRLEYAAHVNPLAIRWLGGQPVAQYEAIDLSNAPHPKFFCSVEDFAPDILFVGELIVSSALIEAMALPEGTFQLVPVDCLACPRAMQAKEYKVLNLLVFANPMDRERSWPAIYTDVELSDGTSTFLWSAPGWQPGMPIPRLFWREDFVAPAPLFRTPGRPWTLATDALAERVLRAGFNDVMFHDPTNDGSRTEGVIMRTLDGTRTIG